MSLRDFVEDILNLRTEGTYKDEEYIVTLDNSNEFSEAFDDIVNNRNLEVVDSDTNSDTCNYIYTNGEYEVQVVADFNKDKYRITVGER